MKQTLLFICLALTAVSMALVGCKKKSPTEQVIEKSKAGTEAAGDSLKDAANKTGRAIEHTADKAWDGIKKAAKEVSHVATNVAGEVKAGAKKTGEKIKEATK